MDKVFKADNASRLLCDDRMRRQPPQGIMDRLGAREGDTWLDLGSGNGFITVPLLSRGCSVVALDLQDEMLRMLRERVPSGDLSRLRTLQTRLPNIPLPDGSADNAVMINVFHEIDDRARLGTELQRVLRRGGALHIVDYRKIKMEQGPPLEHRLSPDEVSAALELSPERVYEDELYYHIVFRL